MLTQREVSQPDVENSDRKENATKGSSVMKHEKHELRSNRRECFGCETDFGCVVGQKLTSSCQEERECPTEEQAQPAEPKKRAPIIQQMIPDALPPIQCLPSVRGFTPFPSR